MYSERESPLVFFPALYADLGQIDAFISLTEQQQIIKEIAFISLRLIQQIIEDIAMAITAMKVVLELDFRFIDSDLNFYYQPVSL